MRKVCSLIKSGFRLSPSISEIITETGSFCLLVGPIDSPEGIEQGFESSIIAADRAIVVVNPEVMSIRDAYR